MDRKVFIKYLDKFREICLHLNINLGDIVALIKIIDKDEVGRYRLTKEVGLGEATTRTILRHLRNSNVLSRGERGHRLTKEGYMIFEYLISKIVEEGDITTPFRLGEYEYFIHIRGGVHDVGSGVEYRDTALLAGARAAVILQFVDNRLIFPDSKEELSKRNPEFNKILINKLSFIEGDILTIVGAENYVKARRGAYAILLSLI
jgi:predicted transcriptional regulator